MSGKAAISAFVSWLAAMGIWQLLFYSHPVVSEILWEIHTIFTSVIVFYIGLNLLLNDSVLDAIKIVFRIIFKVWLIIFLAFSMHDSFDQKAFVLTATFIFGYLEGLIDINSWLRSNVKVSVIPILKDAASKRQKMFASIFCLSAIHILCALIALLFFNID